MDPESGNPIPTCKFCVNCPIQKVKKVEEPNDGTLNINSLPKEILIKIFGYLKQKQLSEIARTVIYEDGVLDSTFISDSNSSLSNLSISEVCTCVCKAWDECAKCDVLWKKADRQVFGTHDTKNEATKDVIKTLRFCTTHLKLDFGYMTDPLMFEELCVMLQEQCPYVHTLIFCYVKLAVSLQSVIKLCAHYLRNVRVLVLRNSQFGSNPIIGDYVDISPLEVLDVRRCFPAVGNRPIFSDMPYLKKLCLADVINVNDDWFVQEDTPFLNQLEVLDMGNTLIRMQTFLSIQAHALHLIELYVCRTMINNFDLSEFAFPQLRTVCLRCCYHVTVDGIVSLIESCESLQNVYVEFNVVLKYEKCDFVAQNEDKLDIVKETDSDNHFLLKHYMQ